VGVRGKGISHNRDMSINYIKGHTVTAGMEAGVHRKEYAVTAET
jgi:hypothetical protein